MSPVRYNRKRFPITVVPSDRGITQLRAVVRRGAVYSLAGALIAFDRTAAVAQGLVKNIRNGVNSISPVAEATDAPAPGATTPTTPAPEQTPVTN